MLTLVVAVAVLYFARLVLIPIALALLLTFLLAPLVIRLRHWGLGRVAAALVVVTFWLAALGLIGSLMTTQLADLTKELPGYQQNIREKLHSIRSSGGGVITRMSRVVRDFSEELLPQAPASPQPQPGEEKPVPVEIRRTTLSPLHWVGSVLGSVVNSLLMAAIVIVCVIFMLIQREDLRDRLIRVIGGGQLHVTTQALDDAAGRVSRYLLAQLAINVLFGVMCGVGLYFMKVPNPALWGMVAVLLRYVPYLGIWISAAMPALIVFAVEPGWMKPIGIFALFIGTDVLILNFLEPLIYGTSTGISPVGILVSAVFWTWLWGPVGLLLATPLTVCLVVLGRYVPKLEFISVVLGDEPVLPPATRFYQRMLAMDVDEAMEVAEEYLKENSLEDLYDEVLIPALSLAEEDRHSGKLDDEHQDFLIQNTRLLLEDLSPRAEEFQIAREPDKAVAAEAVKASKEAKNAPPPEVTVVTIPARDEADELASLMLEKLLSRRGIGAKTRRRRGLAAECIEEVAQQKFRVACVSAVPPRGYTQARYLCKRLHAEFPDLKLVAAFLNEGDVQEIRKRQPAILADELTTTLKQAVAGVVALAAVKNGSEDNSPIPSGGEPEPSDSKAA